MASTAISYEPGSAPLNKKWTFSAWIKRSNLGTDQTIFEGRQNGSNLSRIVFRGGSATNQDSLQLYSENSGTTNVQLQTAKKFRDVNGWYHIVVTVDSTLSTEADRAKIYVNGVQETSFLTSNYPAQDYSGWWTGIGPNVTQVIGSDTVSGSEKFSGSMSHIHYTIGYAYQASTFGSTDTTTGEWKINTSPSVTYGATGFFILKDGNSLTDQSGNSKNFTLGAGTLTKTEDCPSNVFCTMTMGGAAGSYQLSNGNLTCSGNSNNSWKYAFVGQVGANAGKYYWEVKITSCNSHNITGVIRSDKVWTDATLYSGGGWNGLQSSTSAGGLGIYSQTNASMGNALYIGGTSVSLTTNDIIMYALDLDNKKMWVGKNGVWADDGNSGNTGNPSTGAYPLWGTGEFTTGADYLPASSIYYTNAHTYNFGNGYFGTTAVSSAGTNASGIGIFEYDVPTGYTALSTKGLNL